MDQPNRDDGVTPRPIPTLEAVPDRPPAPALSAPALPLHDLGPVRLSPLRTKLHLLDRAHAAAAGERVKARLLFAAGLLGTVVVAGALGALLAVAVFWLMLEDPGRKQTASYYNYQTGHTVYFVEGKESTEMAYRLYLDAHHGDEVRAWTAAVGSAIALFAVLVFLTWLVLLRRIRPAPANLDEQVRAITDGHPAEVQTWGGPAVLRQPALVRELLRLQEQQERGPAARAGSAP